MLRGKVRAHDPFELIRWLAMSQPDPRKALAELVQNSLDAGAKRIRITRIREKGRPCLRILDIRAYRPHYFHAYPSSAAIVARYLVESGDVFPPIRAALIGSENIYPGQREHLQQVFGARVFTWYGHSEKCILAPECPCGAAYRSLPEYGVTELVDEAGESIEDAVWQLLEQMQIAELEIVTLYYGHDIFMTTAETLGEAIRSRYPHLEVEVVEGGQPHYSYIISAE